MYGPEILKWDVLGVKEFIQNLLITTEANQYDQYDEMLINIQSKNSTDDMMYVWLYYTSSQRKNFATQLWQYTEVLVVAQYVLSLYTLAVYYELSLRKRG